MGYQKKENYVQFCTVRMWNFLNFISSLRMHEWMTDWFAFITPFEYLLTILMLWVKTCKNVSNLQVSMKNILA